MHALVNIHEPKTALRIISLVPSQTELLYHLGLDHEVIGITKFCVHPQGWFKNKKRIGGTKNIQLETIIELQPTLILANKEENIKEQIVQLASLYPVYVSDIKDVDSAYKMIVDIGQLTNTLSKAENLVTRIKEQFTSLPVYKKQRALYLIWNNPFMCAGQDTFITQMMALAGFTNIIADNRYPEISEEKIKELQPEVILLSSEPFPFKQKHIEQLQQLVPKAKVILVDGEIFSWYGSRMLHAANYFSTLQQLIHEPNL
jgi:ABC-type Fe3+-hydroxamate transport system substrate-binding protein